MKATLDGTVLADAGDEDIISIEGNAYFPPSSLTSDGQWQDSPTPYTCPWKGVAQYHTVAGQTDAGWSYPQPPAEAVRRVGQDFAGYVGFDKRVVELG
jgi:uncharacterized protein (DUF427 family)